MNIPFLKTCHSMKNDQIERLIKRLRAVDKRCKERLIEDNESQTKALGTLRKKIRADVALLQSELKLRNSFFNEV